MLTLQMSETLRILSTMSNINNQEEVVESQLRTHVSDSVERQWRQASGNGSRSHDNEGNGSQTQNGHGSQDQNGENFFQRSRTHQTPQLSTSRHTQ